MKFEAEANPQATALTVYMRWEAPDTGDVTEIKRSAARADLNDDFAASDPRFQMTAVVAQYAEILRQSYWAKDAGTKLEDVARDAQRIAEYLRAITMSRSSRNLPASDRPVRNAINVMRNKKSRRLFRRLFLSFQVLVVVDACQV